MSKTTCEDVCLLTLFPKIIVNLKKLELLNSSYSFKIHDSNNKEIRKTFSTTENVVDKQNEIRSILKDLLLNFEEIDFNKFKYFTFFTKLNDKRNFILMSLFDDINKKWIFEINEIE